MGGFKMGEMAGTAMVLTISDCLKLPEIQTFA
jgi:hypothetical protein